jgi:hypothetical protein
VEYNCALIKVNWFDACIALRIVSAVFVVFLRRWRKIYRILQALANGQQGPIPEEMFQTLLTNKKQGNLD